MATEASQIIPLIIEKVTRLIVVVLAIAEIVCSPNLLFKRKNNRFHLWVTEYSEELKGERVKKERISETYIK